MSRPRSHLIDAALILVAIGLHLGAAYLLELFPPNRVFEYFIVGLPLLVLVGAVVALLARGDRRGLPIACLTQWLLVIYALPAKFVGLAFVPSAVVLSIALLRKTVVDAVTDDPAEAPAHG